MSSHSRPRQIVAPADPPRAGGKGVPSVQATACPYTTLTLGRLTAHPTRREAARLRPRKDGSAAGVAQTTPMTHGTAEHTERELTEATATGLRWITLMRLVTEVLLLGSMVALARLLP